MHDEDFLRATMPAFDLVHGVARQCTRREADAEDLVQDTYLAAYRAWRRERRPERVEPWLATICLNLARSRHRVLVRRPREVGLGHAPGLDADPPTRVADDPELRALANLDGESVHRALWRLEDGQRLAITLVDGWRWRWSQCSSSLPASAPASC